MENVILQPIEVGGQTFKNRIMFPPLTTGYEKNGMISEQDMGFYTRLAKGGVGYIVMGDVAPINSFSPTPKLFDDSQIPAFKALADSVHAYGTKLGIQIFHPEYDVDAINSLFMQKKFTDEASEEMLMSIIDKMCACAVRAQKAGVDVIQIHGDRLNGCLCSTRMNHRTDKFGGSLENRVRFARMLTRAIRKAVPDMVIDYKLSIVTPQRGKGGIDEADAVQFAQWLVEDGVDMFHVAQANHTGNMADTIPPMGVQPYGLSGKIDGDIKKAVDVPVSAVGRIVDADMAARVIESGMADIVAMGRPLLADPDWGTKIAAGKACDIRRCISCNKGCTDAIQNRQFLSCVLNAENGYENTRSIQPAAQKKKIAVLGGGPAGLEAARVAALRGHDVTLFEKTTTLGGQMNIACVPPRKEEMRRAAQDLIHAVCNAGVHLCMGQTRTAEQLKDAGFEAVINAVGAHSAAPRIPGIDSVNVADAWKVLAGEQQAQQTAGKGQRHGKQHDEGGQQALELCHHDKVDKGQGQCHPLDHLVGHIVDAVALAAHGEGAALRHFVGEGKSIQRLFHGTGLHRGVVARGGLGSDGNELVPVLAGDGVRCGAGGPAGDIRQLAGAGSGGAVGGHDGGLKGHVHHVFLGQRVQIVADLHIHGGAVHGNRGLCRGGGGQLCSDLLVHLRNGQAVGAHLVAVHLQDDG